MNMKTMKIVFTILLVSLAVIACGCTTAAPSATPAAATPVAPMTPTTPSLLGTWTGTMFGYDEGTGYTNYDNATMSMIVTEQQGRIFSGNFAYNFNGTPYTIPMAGVIGSDGRSLDIVEESNGYTYGEITGNSEIQLTYLDNNKPISAAIDILRKV